MSSLLYFDAHVPHPAARELRRRGVDVLTAQDDGTDKWDDPKLLDRATAVGRLLVTSDTDFLVEASIRQHAGTHFPGIVFYHQQQLTVGKLVVDLELIAVAGTPGEFENFVQYLPLG